jgi:hypothetical protein
MVDCRGATSSGAGLEHLFGPQATPRRTATTATGEGLSMLQFPPTGIPVERVAEEYSGGQRVQRVKRGRGSDNQRRRLSEVFDNGHHPKNAADGERS